MKIKRTVLVEFLRRWYRGIRTMLQRQPGGRGGVKDVGQPPEDAMSGTVVRDASEPPVAVTPVPAERSWRVFWRRIRRQRPLILHPMHARWAHRTPNDEFTHWDTAYREAYDSALEGNPVVQTAVARAILDSHTPAVEAEDALWLIRRSAESGYPPALVLDSFHAGDPARHGGALVSAVQSGSDEAVCIVNVMRLIGLDISADELLAELKANNDLTSTVVIMVVLHFMEWTKEADYAAQCREKLIDEMREHSNASRAENRRHLDAKNRQIRNLDSTCTELRRQVSTLSQSTQAAELDSLREELGAARRRADDADRRIAETQLQRDADVAEAVADMKRQLNKTSDELNTAIAEKDEALRRADKAERMVKRLELMIRRLGVDPATGFAARAADVSRTP